MPYELPRCPTCGGGVKFTRSHTWLQPEFFPRHLQRGDSTLKQGGPPPESAFCQDESACPVCRNRDDFGPHLLLWIGRAHYSPEEYLKESRELGVSRRIPAPPKGMVMGETWVLLAHLDAVPTKNFFKGQPQCTVCNFTEGMHSPGAPADVCSAFQAPKPTPGIFCAFIPRAVELILKESDATPERREKEAKRGVTVVAVPDDDKDHQGSVWDGEPITGQEELPGVSS
jgi:hypothetical protein